MVSGASQNLPIAEVYVVHLLPAFGESSKNTAPTPSMGPHKVPNLDLVDGQNAANGLDRSPGGDTG